MHSRKIGPHTQVVKYPYAEDTRSSAVHDHFCCGFPRPHVCCFLTQGGTAGAIRQHVGTTASTGVCHARSACDSVRRDRRHTPADQLNNPAVAGARSQPTSLDNYYYALILLLDHSDSDLRLPGHLRMVVEILIVTYYVIAIPVAIWVLR